jgi:hypothetical protein
LGNKIQTQNIMVTIEQIRELEKRLEALRRYL